MIAHEHEAQAHHDHVGAVGMAKKAGGAAPVAHGDQDDGQCHQLAELHTDIECQQVRNQSIGRDLVFQDLGRETEAVEQAKDQCGQLGIGLEPKPALEGTDVVQRLVNHGKSDDGVDDVAVDPDVEVDPQNHGGRMPQRKQAHVEADVLHPVQEEDDAEEEKDVVVPGHHVFGAEVDEGQQIHPGNFLDVALVAFGHRMGKGIDRAGKQENENERKEE